MSVRPNLRFSHIGFHVRDIERMLRFYTEQLGLAITDRGRLPLPGRPEIVFLSRDPGEHHQIALIEGRRDAPGEPGLLQQVSFEAGSLEDLRRLRTRLEKAGVTRFLPLSHGSAWSLYFPDPEDNGVECFVLSPWHVRQPVTDPLDLSRSDREILEETERICVQQKDFQPRSEWSRAFARRLERSGD